MNFEQLGLIEPLLKALQKEGYTHPTPIQAQSIPLVLKGQDLLGLAQTGTGKTAAFVLPILQRLVENHYESKGYRHIRALILTPTRELASQIGDSIAAYGKHTGLKHEVIFGGVSQHTQTIALRYGTDILVATPGRLLDLMNQDYIHLDYLEHFVLDEADRMLDMGFIHDVKKIVRELPQEKQTLLFSATMPAQIAELTRNLLRNPAKVEVTPVSTTAEKVEQAIYFVSKKDKSKLLVHLLNEANIKRTLVFTRTKHGADRISRDLNKQDLRSDAIHGDKTQGARERALHNFKTGKLRVLVATDIAARGIDVDDLTHVINFDLPNVPETYVHRIGRTGRAGTSGIALSFCDHEERAFLKDITKLIKLSIPVVDEHPFKGNATEQAPPAPAQKRNTGPKNRPSSKKPWRRNNTPANQ
ncbi:DEAD/DEAH box helicase [Flavisolibacter tropicus]|uniref:DEAD-box ATP-dependent RNA helicase RhpA n=1 Tax=Flavisolibacter tropicus TaxID=1492898 RepID=A0A172U0M0_9BACT|nr:DEAD/DEAH box helicase [Flavisolibacter tropicus]ANE52728.1 DEAD/DEAH box helicase [Flavisolibacter tropicus]